MSHVRSLCVGCTRHHENHRYDVVKNVVNKYQNKLKEMTASVEEMIENLSNIHYSISDARVDLRQSSDKINKEID